MPAFIHVQAADRAVKEPLLSRLSREVALNAAVGEGREPAPGDVVIVLSTETTPAGCLRLTAAGLSVIVLAPAERAGEREAYLAAGARGFQLMAVDASELVQQIRALMDPRNSHSCAGPGCAAAG